MSSPAARAALAALCLCASVIVDAPAAAPTTAVGTQCSVELLAKGRPMAYTRRVSFSAASKAFSRPYEWSQQMPSLQRALSCAMWYCILAEKDDSVTSSVPALRSYQCRRAERARAAYDLGSGSMIRFLPSV